MSSKDPGQPITSPALRRQIERTAFRLRQDDPAWQAAFTEAVLAQRSALPALVWFTDRPTPNPFPIRQIATWQPDWCDVLEESSERTAGRHPLHAAGNYYCLDFSSVVSASSLRVVQDSGHPIHTIIDLCAAPGGKALMGWRILQPAELICNEVVGKRHGMLYSNLERTGAMTISTVTQADPSVLAGRYREAADVVLVDAPCSGQSLIAKGDSAPGSFQDHIVAANMSRQRRILANAIKLVAPGGYLCYMTCAYSREENEKNVEWLLRRFPEYTAQVVPHLEEAGLRSWLLDAPCYRHSPQDGIGAGGFVALLRKAA